VCVCVCGVCVSVHACAYTRVFTHLDESYKGHLIFGLRDFFMSF